MKYTHGKHPNSRNGFKKGNKIGSQYRVKKGQKLALGYKHTKEAKRKMSKAKKGKSTSWLTGRKVTNKTRKKISLAISKEKHWNWKGGITPIRKKLYFSAEYKLWRKAVFERDKYTCIWCGYKGNKLQADHIKPWCDYPELRFAIDNGRTLCIDCHKTTDTYGVHD